VGTADRAAVGDGDSDSVGYERRGDGFISSDSVGGGVHAAAGVGSGCAGPSGGSGQGKRKRHAGMVDCSRDRDRGRALRSTPGRLGIAVGAGCVGRLSSNGRSTLWGSSVVGVGDDC